MSEFCHLHCHTHYSLLDGAAATKKLAKRAKALGIGAVAITDHGNLFGLPSFYKDARAEGVQPILGCEFYLTPSGMADKTDKTRYHQVLLAKNLTGYRNLCKLASLAYSDGYYYKPRIDRETLRNYSEGLIATTCCLQGEVLQTILRKGEAEARKVFEAYLDIFGDDYYIELQDHAIPEQKQCNAVLVRWAEEYGVKAIATNDVHYVDQADSEAQDVLLCLQTGADRSDPKRMRFENDQFYLKTEPEMLAALADIPERVAREALATTREVADKCAFDLPMGDLLMPQFPIPAAFNNDADAYLRHLTYEGARRRYPEMPQSVVERLDYELSVIAAMKFAGYFLIVQDFTTAARTLGVSVGPGRGSAAGSAVAYCLGITNIDPIPYELLFERFLNPERVSMPDVDIDFDDRGRGKVIDYVVDKYGRENVCQIVTFGTMGAKTALRDVSRVLGIPISEADRISKLVPDGAKVNFASALKDVPEFRALRDDPNPQIRQLMQFAEVLEGSARHTGVHAAGVIIAPGRVSDYVPTQTVKSKGGDVVTTQYDGSHIESFGLLKMDFLGLKTLTVLNDALALIKENHGVEIDLDTLPLDDEKTYRLFQRGETVSIFQFESSGMREWMVKLKPTCIDDLIAMNALYRPGPMDLIPTYIARKHGHETVEHPHPMLEPILAATYGIPVYQEQVMQMAQVMGGYTLGGADLLRRAMGKKDAAKMAVERDKFVAGAGEKGVGEKKATEVFDMMEKFAGYGFNKCGHGQTKVTLADGTRTTLARAYRTQPDALMSMWDDGEIRPHRVARIVRTGRKPLLKVTTATGRVIKVTAEHRLLTTAGYLPVSEMEAGVTELITESRRVSDAQRTARRANMARLNRTPEQRTKASQRMTAYQAARPMADKVAHMRRMHETHPDLTRAGAAAMHERIKWLHAHDPAWRQAQMERTLATVRAAYDSGPGFGLCSIASNGMWCASRGERAMCEWLVEQGIDFEMHKVLANGRICDFYFAGLYWEMDGMDRTAAYFAEKYGDLPHIVVTPEDFKSIVASRLALDHVENGDLIASIEPCGEAMTYDVEMAPDGPLNFLANGIVSHNSHSAAYSLVAYHTAYLKAHYPAEFMAAAMTNDMGDSDKLAIVLDEARTLGLEILGPDVNRSRAHFTVEDGRIRFGLGAIKGVGLGAIEHLEHVRNKVGEFRSFFGFVKALDLRVMGKKMVESLVLSGALDRFDGHRAAFVAALDGAVAYAQRAATEEAQGMMSLFGGGAAGPAAPEPALPLVEPMPRAEALKHERDLVGFYISGHPLDAFKLEVSAFASHRIADIATEMGETDTLAGSGDGQSGAPPSPGGGRDSGGREGGGGRGERGGYGGGGGYGPRKPQARICGLVTSVQRRITQKGKPMLIACVEDFTGTAEVIVFAREIERIGSYIELDAPLLIRGEVEVRGGAVKMIANEVMPMWKAREELIGGLRLRLDLDTLTEAMVDDLDAVCAEHRGPVTLTFELAGGPLKAPVVLRSRKTTVEPTAELLAGLVRVVGQPAITIEEKES